MDSILIYFFQIIKKVCQAFTLTIYVFGSTVRYWTARDWTGREQLWRAGAVYPNS